MSTPPPPPPFPPARVYGHTTTAMHKLSTPLLLPFPPLSLPSPSPSPATPCKGQSRAQVAPPPVGSGRRGPLTPALPVLGASPALGRSGARAPHGTAGSGVGELHPDSCGNARRLGQQWKGGRGSRGRKRRGGRSRRRKRRGGSSVA